MGGRSATSRPIVWTPVSTPGWGRRAAGADRAPRRAAGAIRGAAGHPAADRSGDPGGPSAARAGRGRLATPPPTDPLLARRDLGLRLGAAGCRDAGRGRGWGAVL